MIPYKKKLLIFEKKIPVYGWYKQVLRHSKTTETYIKNYGKKDTIKLT